LQAVGYSCLPSTKNADGLVAMMFPRPKSQVVSGQQQVIDTLTRMMCQGKQNMSVCVESVRELPDDW
jgi:nuclear pore complex protein Nup54